MATFGLPQFSALADYWPLTRLDRALTQEIQRECLLPSLFSSDDCAHMAPMFTHYNKIEVWWGVLPFYIKTWLLAYCQTVTLDKYIFFINSLLKKVPHRNIASSEWRSLWTVVSLVWGHSRWQGTGHTHDSMGTDWIPLTTITLGFTSSLLLFIIKTWAQKTSVMI